MKITLIRLVCYLLVCFSNLCSGKELDLNRFMLIGGDGEIDTIQGSQVVEKKHLLLNGAALRAFDSVSFDYDTGILYVRPLRGFERRGFAVYDLESLRQLAFLPKVASIELPKGSGSNYVLAGYLDASPDFPTGHDINVLEADGDVGDYSYFRLLHRNNARDAHPLTDIDQNRNAYCLLFKNEHGLETTFHWDKEKVGWGSDAKDHPTRFGGAYIGSPLDCSGKGEFIFMAATGNGTSHPPTQYLRRLSRDGRLNSIVTHFEDTWPQCFGLGASVERVVCIPYLANDCVQKFEIFNLVKEEGVSMALDKQMQYTLFNGLDIKFAGYSDDYENIFFTLVNRDRNAPPIILAVGSWTEYQLSLLTLPKEIRSFRPKHVIARHDWR